MNIESKVVSPPRLYVHRLINKNIYIYKYISSHKYASSRSSRSQMFFKIGVLKILAIFTEKHRNSNTGVYCEL